MAGNIETEVLELKVELSAIRSLVPQLATKADLPALELAITKWVSVMMLLSFGMGFAIAYSLSA